MLSEFEQALARIRQETTLIETRAKSASFQLQNLTRETESSKVELLQKLFEDKIKSETRRRGAASIIRDGNRLRTSILWTAGSFIVGGLVTRDEKFALDSALAGFNGALQGFGRSRWFVQLGERIVVTATEFVPSEEKWIAWETLKSAMVELRKKVLAEDALGNLDDVLHKLQQGIRSLPMSTSPSVNQTATRANWRMFRRSPGPAPEND
jgi:hypothetical protein